MTIPDGRGTMTGPRVVGEAVAVPGFVHGLRHPCVLATVAGCTAEVRPDLADWLRRTLSAIGIAPGGTEPASGDDVPASLLDGLRTLRRAAGLPGMETGRLIRVLPDDRAVIAVPTLGRGHRQTFSALQWMARACTADGPSRVALEAALPALLDELGTMAPAHSNTSHFLRAAHELDMPVMEMPGQVFQFGQGARGRWMDSSFTDETPQIAARLARDKTLAAAMLRQAGIPVPAHARVADEDAALRAAQALGYPVVVKPADLDGGAGVSAGLRTPEEVRQAWHRARALSTAILVEKHVEGRDHRLTVFRGELIWAIERVPGGVTGDGTLSVGELVDRVNEDPRRGTGPRAALTRLELDDEARELLARDGLDTESVPPAGHFVRLRRAANVAGGGTPVSVADRVHPDNALLAVRAAAALRLDLAGIDLLIPDIGRSWRETGAAICEVNAQPRLGVATAAHLYAPLLRELVDGDGRVPIVVVMGAGPDDRLAADIGTRLRAAGLRAGWLERAGITVDGRRVLDGPVGALAGGRILMTDRSVESAVIDLHDPDAWRTGLPFDRFDLLVLADPRLEPGADAQAAMPMRRVLDAVLPACRGPVLRLASPAAGTGNDAPPGRLARAALIDEVASVVLRAARSGAGRTPPFWRRADDPA